MPEIDEQRERLDRIQQEIDRQRRDLNERSDPGAGEKVAYYEDGEIEKDKTDRAITPG